ncbi:MAG: hypothetical protein ABR534_08530 [Desulfotignum sp.]|nr:hypothetical protein [Desulfobacteraceae bacterium]
MIDFLFIFAFLITIYDVAGHQWVVQLAILTRISMTGTYTSTPTIAAGTAGDQAPSKVMATPEVGSKKWKVPIKPAGAAT